MKPFSCHGENFETQRPLFEAPACRLSLLGLGGGGGGGLSGKSSSTSEAEATSGSGAITVNNAGSGNASSSFSLNSTGDLLLVGGLVLFLILALFQREK